jgi:Flp pilus assembly protein TadG
MKPVHDNQPPRARHAGHRIVAHLHRFRQEEDGVMVAFSMLMLLTMLIVGGIGVDIMRFEMDRSRLQNTLDRAVLAAADLDQELNARDVVTDYFTKAGLAQYLTNIDVQEGLGSKRVEASAETEFNTFFLKLMGISTLTASANGAAQESIDGLEISLVLDVSGSMDRNSRLTRLKPAAKDFVAAILNSADTGNVSISIVPYATQVSAGALLLDEMDVTSEHSYSHCVNFDSDAFDSTGLVAGETLERTGHFDPWNYSSVDRDELTCSNYSHREILPFSGSVSALQTYIDNLDAEGNTSIDLGLKWGTLLLDDDMQSVVTELIADGEVSSSFEGRPVAQGEGGLMKIIVLMTDGQNTSQYYLRDDYREGGSGIYKWSEDEDDEYWSIYRASTGEYYWLHDDSWHDVPYGDDTEETTVWEEQKVCSTERVRKRVCGYNRWGRWRCRNKWVDEEVCSMESVPVTTTGEQPGEAVEMSFPELWSKKPTRWYNDWWWLNDPDSSYGNSTKDDRTDSICDAAKDAGIVLYTIGFEAPSDAETLLKNCASSDGHYFDVDGLEIEDAFSSIAASIRKLRLIQ